MSSTVEATLCVCGLNTDDEDESLLNTNVILLILIGTQPTKIRMLNQPIDTRAANQYTHI